MLTHTSQTLLIALIAILFPAALSFPYPIYGMKNYQRASRASSNGPSLPISRQRYDQNDVYRSPSSSQYYGNYDSLYDSGADNYYVDDEGDDRPEREYLYGKPTYHGEYKPTRYYYARAPNYNNDHAESTNPLDDLHEEMLQEEHRQQNWPSGKPNWFQNTGQPKSLTSNFMKNLMLYNNGLNGDTQPADLNNAYDDGDGESAYPGDLSNQNEPYDYYDPLKIQSQQFNYFNPSSATANKPTYFNQANRKETDYTKQNNKNYKPNDYDETDSHEDKEEKDLESLRKNAKNSWEKINDNENQLQSDANKFGNIKPEDTHNVGYDSAFDYDDDEWINWERKRSLPKKQNDNLRPLKVLEYQLTKALQEQGDASKVILPTVPPTTIPTSNINIISIANNNKVHEHKGQKEVVLSRPATPLRRHFSESVLEALTKTTNEMQQPNQGKIGKPNTQVNEQHSSGTKKQKRFVSSETSLAQQLNDLKQKIKA